MHERYIKKSIAEIWSTENKLGLWQKTELMAIKARVILGLVAEAVFLKIEEILTSIPIDILWWKNRDKEIRHDLNAFLDERLRHLPLELQRFLHEDMTSYDTEEPAFVRMLADSVDVVFEATDKLMETLKQMALKYRYTIMNARTHGQEAKLQSFGKKCLTWLAALQVDFDNLMKAADFLKYAKLSGAVGNYGDMDPEVEEETLKLLGFEPFYGATQILPRELFTPLAQALCQIVQTLDKIANDIRLGARSGRPIFQEPFGKKQKGSSAMPHKKNTIQTEQIEGMARMARGYMNMILEMIKTWEERTIEQSCEERVAWPDLFHVAIHSLEVMDAVLSGLQVYSDNMLLEIVDSCGTYASEEAKKILRELLAERQLSSETAYRIVQLAAFNALSLSESFQELRDFAPASLRAAELTLEVVSSLCRQEKRSIQQIIPAGALHCSPQLEATEDDVAKWNEVLKDVFSDQENLKDWNQIFQPSYLLRHEPFLFQKLLGE